MRYNNIDYDDHFNLDFANDTINGISTKEEIEKVISKLKWSDDENEFIKHSTCKMLAVLVKLLNVIFRVSFYIDTGKIPWYYVNIR